MQFKDEVVHMARIYKNYDVASLAFASILVVAVQSIRADSICLYEQAAVEGPDVRLCDVAELKGPTAQKLGNLVVGTLSPSHQKLRIELFEVIRIVTSNGKVNWALLTVMGYKACEVDQIDQAFPSSASNISLPVDINSSGEVKLGSPVTIRDWLIEMIERFAQKSRGELKITFADRDAVWLNGDARQGQLEFEPLSASPLGRLPIAVRQYQNSGSMKSRRITVNVSRRVMAVIAARRIDRGHVFVPEDLEVGQIYLNDERGEPLNEIENVVGQQATSRIHKGTAIYTVDAALPLLVRRGQIITVRCICGGLVIRTIGRAMEDGTESQIIRVRNEKSREDYQARVTALRQAVVITDANNLREGCTSS